MDEMKDTYFYEHDTYRIDNVLFDFEDALKYLQDSVGFTKEEAEQYLIRL